MTRLLLRYLISPVVKIMQSLKIRGIQSLRPPFSPQGMLRCCLLLGGPHAGFPSWLSSLLKDIYVKGFYMQVTVIECPQNKMHKMIIKNFSKVWYEIQKVKSPSLRCPFLKMLLFFLTPAW